MKPSFHPPNLPKLPKLPNAPSRTKWIVTGGAVLIVVGALALSARTSPPTLRPVGSSSLPYTPAASAPGCSLIHDNANPPPGATVEFKTDWSKHCVLYSDIISGGPVKDQIPSLDAPKFMSVNAANAWLKPVEPVIFVQIGNDARAYPIQIVIWHEVVNDSVGGLPLVVTFCPLCNTALVFERTVNGRELDFGTTGRLRYSNLLMYDRQTESWWQQAIGQAVVGDLTGTQLVAHPTAIISWAAFKADHPDGLVLSHDTGFARPYGQDPYPGYDNINTSPFLYQGPQTPGTLPQLARILAVTNGSAVTAYPFDVLEQVHVVNDGVGGTAIVVFWTPGTSSPVNGDTTADGQDVGSATAFARTVDGKTLTFIAKGANFIDSQTGTTWDPLGRATSGPLVGQSLAPVQSVNAFWFAWVAFRPDTRVYHP
jgi:Protein of unknown function (DUF3179)